MRNSTAVLLAGGAGLAAVLLAGCGTPAAVTVTAPSAVPATSQVPAPVKTVYVQAPAAPAAPAVPAMTNCTGGAYAYDQVWAGANTSCPFALNVAADYSGPGTDYAYSPATGQEYAMNCAVEGADAVVCTGGNGAYVRF